MGRGGRGGFSIINKKLSERQLNFKASFWAGERSCELFCPHKWILLYCIALAVRQASDRAKARRHAKALPLMLSSPLRSSCLFSLAQATAADVLSPRSNPAKNGCKFLPLRTVNYLRHGRGEEKISVNLFSEITAHSASNMNALCRCLHSREEESERSPDLALKF